MKSLRTYATAAVLGGAAGLLGCAGMGTVQEEIISERGGFSEPEFRLADDSEVDYCAAEVLRIRHDPETDLLRIADGRALLDCCGRRSLRVERVGGPEGGVIEVVERDEPDAGGRCEPRCAFDFAAGVLASPRAPITVRVLREVTDSGRGPVLLWEGEVDPAAGARSIVLDKAPAAPGCNAPAP